MKEKYPDNNIPFHSRWGHFNVGDINRLQELEKVLEGKDAKEKSKIKMDLAIISVLLDAGAGTSAHRAAGNVPCVTISLDLKFIGSTKLDDEIIGFTKIQKKTKTLVFLICHLQSKGKIVASASGIWKILNSNTIAKSRFGG